MRTRGVPRRTCPSEEKTYCVHANESTGWQQKHVFTVNAEQCGGEGHREMAHRLRELIAERDLDKAAAVALCKQMLAESQEAPVAST